ncbi:helix-turn-helix domain-containing protein [Reinekea forsetii]|nr:helix-turn-helix domain-containing protein [Reinekea forsetii]
MNIETPTTLQYPLRNELLAQLTPSEFARIAPHLKMTLISDSTDLNLHTTTPKFAIFPLDAVISLFNADQYGNSNQVTMIGHEGMLGTSLITNSMEPFSAKVQAAGIAVRIEQKHLLNELEFNSSLFPIIIGYLQSLISQIGQTLICQRLHSIEQQFGRWLLLALDQYPNNQIDMTQESLGLCLGVRRESITEAAGKLQRLGIIQYKRGHIQVINRAKLEMLSCDCYSKPHSTILKPVQTAPSHASPCSFIH